MTVEKWAHGQLGVDIWNKKYNYLGKESFNEWLDRISARDSDLRDLMEQKKFLFGGRILANRGLQKYGKKITYSNCFVIEPPQDNLESIYIAAQKMARTYSYGGGVGLDLSNLRPRDARTNNAANNSTGAVSFMELYDMTTGLISQQGRRGALMLSIDCTHPDLEEFIGIKQQNDKITKANISIKITDAFMTAVRDNTDWELSFTVDSTQEKITKTVNAKKIMMMIAESNHSHAEPGSLFWDSINNWNLLSEDKDFKYAGVNPCAEEPLPAGGSCLLGSVNLSEFVNNPFSRTANFNYDDFYATVCIAVKSLNDILDEGLPLLPLIEQKESVANYRQIGLGIMGLADMLLKLGIRYGSPEALEISDKIGEEMINAALQQSALLAKEFGPYPKFKKTEVLSSAFLKSVANEETMKMIEKYGLRNSQLLTCAPTGTLSTMLGISGGIEPIFNYGYDRRTQSLHGEDVIYKVYTPIVENYIKTFGLKDESELPPFFNNAMILNWRERIAMQSVWQHYIDASISSTVNLPEETTVQEVFDLYLRAWEAGLKGITVYRDNCSRQGILTNKKEEPVKPVDEEEDTSLIKKLRRGEWAELPEDIVYYKRKLRTGCGKLNVFIGYSEEDKQIHDLYAVRSGSGGCEKSVQTTIIAMAGMLRLGGNIFNIEKAFNGTGGCSSFLLKRAKGENLSKGSSCGTAVLFDIKSFLEEKGADRVTMSATPTVTKSGKKVILEPTGFEIYEKDYLVKHGEISYMKMFNKCPLCNEKLIHTDGCITCTSCGYSKCD